MRFPFTAGLDWAYSGRPGAGAHFKNAHFCIFLKALWAKSSRLVVRRGLGADVRRSPLSTRCSGGSSALVPVAVPCLPGEHSPHFSCGRLSCLSKPYSAFYYLADTARRQFSSVSCWLPFGGHLCSAMLCFFLVCLVCHQSGTRVLFNECFVDAVATTPETETSPMEHDTRRQRPLTHVPIVFFCSVFPGLLPRYTGFHFRDRDVSHAAWRSSSAHNYTCAP